MSHSPRSVLVRAIAPPRKIRPAVGFDAACRSFLATPAQRRFDPDPSATSERVSVGARTVSRSDARDPARGEPLLRTGAKELAIAVVV